MLNRPLSFSNSTASSGMVYPAFSTSRSSSLPPTRPISPSTGTPAALHMSATRFVSAMFSLSGSLLPSIMTLV